MLYKVESGKSLIEVAHALEAAAQRHKFGAIAVHDLKAKLKEKGVDFEPDCLIYEVCNPHQAKKVLDDHPDIATALPCRIALYRTGSKSVLSSIRPTALIGMFQTPEIQAVAEEVERTILTIMNESAEPSREH